MYKYFLGFVPCVGFIFSIFNVKGYMTTVTFHINDSVSIILKKSALIMRYYYIGIVNRPTRSKLICESTVKLLFLYFCALVYSQKESIRYFILLIFLHVQPKFYLFRSFELTYDFIGRRNMVNTYLLNTDTTYKVSIVFAFFLDK